MQQIQVVKVIFCQTLKCSIANPSKPLNNLFKVHCDNSVLLVMSLKLNVTSVALIIIT